MRKREPGKIAAVWSRISHRGTDVDGGGEQLVQERPALLVGANVVRAQ